MNAVMNRRRVLLGGSALGGAALLQGLSVGMLGSLLSGRALGEIAKPSAMIRMSSNENPYGPSQLAISAMEEAFSKSNLYGGIEDKILALQSSIEKVPAESITMSAGSGEILQIGALLMSLEPGTIVAAYPTYDQLTRAAEQFGNEIIRVPVKKDTMEVDLDAMYQAIRPDTRMVYLCNPNNPLPTIIEKKKLEDFVRTVSKDRLVFIDEAYYEYVDNPDFSSMMHLVAEGLNNVIIARTASKIHGFAGLRVGFGFAHPDLIKKMNQFMTGSVNILAQHAAYASYQDKEFQNLSRAKNREGLDILEGMYQELGLRYVKSNANFSFFETGIDVADFRKAMADKNIAVGRPFPPFTTWARVSIAKPEEMSYFVQTYKGLYA
jgi:histidinol-phosphate aminotransferase